eukprot:638872-Pelagomonas_calceolata.AAC.4
METRSWQPFQDPSSPSEGSSGGFNCMRLYLRKACSRPNKHLGKRWPRLLAPSALEAEGHA